MRRATITKTEEHWNSYELDDGTIVRAKLTVIAISIDKLQPNEAGEPRVQIKSQTLIDVLPAENKKH